jgi:hypothetical protein
MTIPPKPNGLPKRVAALVVIIAAATAACGGGRGANGPESAQSDATASVDSMGVAPTAPATIPIRSPHDLRESSALAASHDRPGLFFTINDSGNEPVLFALDTSGADRGAWRVQGAKNVDWEALAVGPCGRVAPACVYIGDVGDNDATHPSRTIYRIAEPHDEPRPGPGSVRAAGAMTVTYADGAHDVEAMYVAGNGDLFLVTKRALEAQPGRLRPALVFRIPSSAWATQGRVVAELVDSLSIVPGSAPLRAITDAALSPDGRWVAVRTYSQLYVYATDATTGRVDASTPPSICDVTSLGEAQGEGVAWIASSGRFAFSSEGTPPALRLADCPPPRAAGAR